MAYNNWKVNPLDRVTGNIKKAVTFDGVITNIGALPKIGGIKVTRHHIIDIKTVQDVWNQACDLEDDQVIDALCEWAGCPPRQLQYFIRNKAAAPMKLIQAICWNPFNIVVGVGSNVRMKNPGDHEFDYIAFVDQRNLTIAKQEFNIHIKRLRNIELYMKQYCNLETPSPLGGHLRAFASLTIRNLDTHMQAHDRAVNATTINSLVNLLKSDKPSCYPTLFSALRSNVNPNAAEVNQVNDMKKPGLASAFSSAYIPGCLIDPSLWSQDGLFSPAQFFGPATF